MRFVATGDLHLGMTAKYLGDEARPRYLRARMDVLRRIGEVAEETGSQFVVAAGDVFESNHVDRDVILRACEVLRSIPVPVYLLPGNHDPLSAMSVYDSPVFEDRRPSNVHVLRDTAPVTVGEGAQVVGVPWHGKNPGRDLLGEALDTLDAAPPGTVRVVVAHGPASTLNPDKTKAENVDVAKTSAAIEEGKAQFVVLGDRHSTTEVAGSIWYPGSPEVTDRRDMDAGNVLVVDVEEGVAPTVSKVQVGSWDYKVVHAELVSAEDAEELVEALEEVEYKERTVMWLRLSGGLSASQKVWLDAALLDLSPRFAKLEVDRKRSDLTVIPDDTDFAQMRLSGYAGDALLELLETTKAEDPAQARVAADALSLLYRLAGGMAS